MRYTANSFDLLTTGMKVNLSDRSGDWFFLHWVWRDKVEHCQLVRSIHNDTVQLIVAHPSKISRIFTTTYTEAE